MTVRMVAFTILAGGVVWAIEPPAGQKTAKTEKTEEGVVEPKADAALHKMSDYLSGLKSVRASATTTDEKVTKEGQKIQEMAESKMIMQRPGELRVEREGPKGHSIVVDDGKQFVAYNREKNVYATAPAPEKLDKAIDELRERLHVDAPGGDLMVSDPYSELMEGTVTGRYVGLEPVEGSMAHHLAFTRKDLDWQIWIKDGPEAVPLRYVITTKDLPGQPQFTLQVHRWQANPEVSPQDFLFTPPATAKRVQLTAPKTKGE
jgi:hypothetical protein